jgi:hypothetical protein
MLTNAMHLSILVAAVSLVACSGPTAGETSSTALHAAFFGQRIGGPSTFLWLFKNGMAWRGWPDEGFDGFDVEKAAAEDRDKQYNYGTWRQQGNAIEVIWRPNYREVYEFDGRFLYPGLMMPVSGGSDVVLHGWWGRDQTSLGDVAIHFKPDGSFEDEGVIWTISSNTKERPPEGFGSGRWTLRDFTLELQYDTGQTIRMACFVPADKTKASDIVWVNSYALQPKER